MQNYPCRQALTKVDLRQVPSVLALVLFCPAPHKLKRIRNKYPRQPTNTHTSFSYYHSHSASKSAEYHVYIGQFAAHSVALWRSCGRTLHKDKV